MFCYQVIPIGRCASKQRDCSSPFSWIPSLFSLLTLCCLFIFSHNLTRNITDRWWKMIHASSAQGRSGQYSTESGRSHSATPCSRLHWRHVWPSGTAARKSETCLSPRLVCIFSLGLMCSLISVFLCFLFSVTVKCNQRLPGKRLSYLKLQPRPPDL